MEETSDTCLFEKVLKILKDENVLGTSENGAVIDYIDPENLKAQLDISLDKPSTESEFLEICKKVAKYSVKTGHPLFVNQLYGGVDSYGLAGALVSEALNTNQYTFEVAPAFTLCEMEVIKKSLELFGFEEGDGIFSPGGSISNMYGMVLAKYKKNPESKQKGLWSQAPYIVYTSEDGVNWLGIGTDNIVKVPTDEKGHMVPSELEKAIIASLKSGKTPLFVNCTAGTTVLGAFDRFNELADICIAHNVWMHVDACWGGSLAFSKKHKSCLNGVNRADSISWNPHKMLGAPLQCSIILVKHKDLLNECNMAGATYLFQKDKMYNPMYDSGDKSIQCGRKVDAFKLWAMWKINGASKFGELVDNAINCSKYFLEKIKTRPGFILVLDEFESSNICFWFVPIRLREKTKNENWWKEIHEVAPKLKRKLVESKCLMIGYQPLAQRGLANFFRLVVTCRPERNNLHMDRIIQLIEEHGNNL